MNWNPLHWLKLPGHDEPAKAFAVGIIAARDRFVAAQQAVSLKARYQGLEDTLGAIDYAESFDDPSSAKAEALALFKQAIIEQARTVQGLMQNPLPEGRERDEALAAPFSDADDSGTATAALPSWGQRALPSETSDTTSRSQPPQPRRPRGRPRKHPKPEAHQVEQGGEPSPEGPEVAPE